jgi:hypothetical protein
MLTGLDIETVVYKCDAEYVVAFYVFSEVRPFVAFAIAIIRALVRQRSTLMFLVSVFTIVLLLLVSVMHVTKDVTLQEVFVFF